MGLHRKTDFLYLISSCVCLLAQTLLISCISNQFLRSSIVIAQMFLNNFFNLQKPETWMLKLSYHHNTMAGIMASFKCSCSYAIHRCENGYHGNALLGSSDHCRPCMCPDGPGRSRQFADTCYQDPNLHQVLCVCSQGYKGKNIPTVSHFILFSERKIYKLR